MNDERRTTNDDEFYRRFATAACFVLRVRVPCSCRSVGRLVGCLLRWLFARSVVCSLGCLLARLFTHSVVCSLGCLLGRRRCGVVAALLCFFHEPLFLRNVVAPMCRRCVVAATLLRRCCDVAVTSLRSLLRSCFREASFLRPCVVVSFLCCFLDSKCPCFAVLWRRRHR